MTHARSGTAGTADSGEEGQDESDQDGDELLQVFDGRTAFQGGFDNGTADGMRAPRRAG